jgi:hypothetical protein
MITQSRLKEILHYDQDTGIFTWKVNKARTARSGGIAGTPNTFGHITICVDKNRIVAHRLAWLYVFGEFPISSLDHINRNPADNRIENLRIVSQSENNLNQGRRKDNTSGHRGIRWNYRYGKYVSRIKKDGKEYHLGLFENLQDAVDARNMKAVELYPNIPEAII